MEFKLLNDSIIGSKNEKGIYIYKANPQHILKAPFKKDGSLRQPYKDLPRYDVIIEAEDQFIKDYDKELKESVKEMATILNSFGK